MRKNETGTHRTVAEWLTNWIEESGKTVDEIAQEIGLESSSAITMMKLGRVMVPMSKIAPLADALGCVHPAHFLRLVLTEYMPDTWAAITELMTVKLLTKNELALIDTLREAFRETDPVMVVNNELTLSVVLL